MVITKVCCLCSLDGQPLRLVLHCGLVSWPKSSLIFHGIRKLKELFGQPNTRACLWCQGVAPTTETRALPVRWHPTAGTKVPKVLVGPSLNHSAPQALAPRDCDGSGSSVWEWQLSSLNSFGDHSSLSWRVVPSFQSDAY